MAETNSDRSSTISAGAPLSPRVVSRIPMYVIGMSLGMFLAISYVLCVLFDMWFPALAMNPVWSLLLPGFAWLSWSSFFLGLVETFAYGWYIALVFVPLYNFFAMRTGAGIRP